MATTQSRFFESGVAEQPRLRGNHDPTGSRLRDPTGSRRKPPKFCPTEELTFPAFEENQASTMTIVIMLNITMDIKKVFEILPVTNYIVVPKKHGRRKKNADRDPNEDIPIGSIITLEYTDENSRKVMRGVRIKAESTKIFKNSVTTVMILENKMINFKFSQNGVIQMTGCKSDQQAEDCVRFIWHYIAGYNDLYTFKDPGDTNLKAIFVPAMRNIDFSLGFLVNRESLDDYINFNTEHRSIFDPNYGHTGTNIKFSVNRGPEYLTQVEYPFPLWTQRKRKGIHRSSGSKRDVEKGMALAVNQLKKQTTRGIVYSKVKYGVYLDMLSHKDRLKKIRKDSKKQFTFMVFHSGKTIMSAGSVELARGYYYSFIELMKSCRSEIEEKLS